MFKNWTRTTLAVALGAAAWSATAQTAHEDAVAAEMNAIIPMLESEGFEVVATADGFLETGEADFMDFVPDDGWEYIVAAACDGDCTDIDMLVEDEMGTLIGIDEATDDRPNVAWLVDQAITHTATIGMVECDAGNCYYGVVLMRR